VRLRNRRVLQTSQSSAKEERLIELKAAADRAMAANAAEQARLKSMTASLSVLVEPLKVCVRARGAASSEW
jgi:hypothetical protein